MKNKFIKMLVIAGVVAGASVALAGCGVNKKKDKTPDYEISNFDTEFFCNETFSMSGAKLVITLKDGTEEIVPITDEMIKNMPDMSTPGKKTVIIEYDGVEYKVTITVASLEETSYKVTGEKTYYTDETELNLNYHKLVISYNNGTHKTVDVTKDMVSAADFTRLGKQTIAIRYNGKYYYFQINVVELAVTSYRVSGVKQKYYDGDTLNYNELKLVLTYNNGTHETVNVTENMVGSVNFSTEGQKDVTINYDGEQYKFKITVGNRAKDEAALQKIQTFLSDLNTRDIKGSSLKITLNGNAKFLQNNAEFNNEILSIVTDTAGELNLNEFETGLEIYKADNGKIICYKEFDNQDEMFAFEQKVYRTLALSEIDVIFLLNWTNAPETFQDCPPKDRLVTQMLIDLSAKTTLEIYGTRKHSFADCKQFLTHDYIEEDLQNFQRLANETITDLIVSKIVFVENNAAGTDIYINTAVGKQVYEKIIKFILNASGQLQSENILDSTNLKASLDLVKILSQLTNKETSQELVNGLVKNLLDKNPNLAENAAGLLAQVFGITDSNSVNQIKGVLDTQLNNLKQNFNSTTIYNAVKSLNSALQSSGGNQFFLAQLDNLVNGLNPLSKHLASDIASDFRHFARIETREFNTTADASELKQNPGDNKRREFEREKDGIYYYYDATSIANEQELVNKYFDGLTAIIRSLEDIDQQTNVETLANSIVDNLRKMDEVIQTIKQHNDGVSDKKDLWWDVAVTDIGFTYFRMFVEQYKQMYQSGYLQTLIDAMGYIYPADFSFDVMVMKGTDMEPTIKEGEYLITRYIENPKAGDIRVGDIIVQQKGYCETVVAIFNENGKIYYITHADGLPSTDVEKLKLQEQQHGLTLSWVRQNCPSLKWRDNDSEICLVVEHTECYIPLQLPAHLVEMLTECSGIINDAFSVTGKIDYVQLIKDLCARFNLEADYYIDQYNKGELHLIRDIAEKTIITEDMKTYTGDDKPIYEACLDMCDWLDQAILQQKFDFTTCLDKIHNIARQMSIFFGRHSEAVTEQANAFMLLLTVMTDTSQDWQTNLKSYIIAEKEMISTLITESFCSTIPDLPETGKNNFKALVNKHLNNYIKGRFDAQALISDFSTFINTYANESGKTIYRSGFVMAMLLSGINNPYVDYNELLSGLIELPNEIKEVDFNTLIRQTLQDGEFYGKLVEIENVEIQFVEQNGIKKEIMTLTIKTNYNIMFSSMDVTTTLTFEILF